MNRATRDRFVSGTDQADLTTGNACWETPPGIFAALHERYAFDIDLTADPRRALRTKWLGPGSPWHEDALIAPWHLFGRRGFSNPPYGPFIQELLPHAKHEASKGFFSVLLLPLRVTEAFRSHVLQGAAELLFCDMRITFFENGAPRRNPRTGRPDSALFDSIVVVYIPGYVGVPRVGTFHVPEHAS